MGIIKQSARNVAHASPVKEPSMGTSYVLHLNTAFFDGHLNYCIVVLKDVKLSSAIEDGQTRRNIIN